MSASGSEWIFAKPGVIFCTSHCSLPPKETFRLPKVQPGPISLRCPLLQHRCGAFIPTAMKCCSGKCCLPAFMKPQFGVHSWKS